MSIKVSVILPVFNVEACIERCIDSLKAQTLGELEFIFVDDCSTDNSMAAVEAWAEHDERVRILRNEQNIGAGPSRNRGIEVARGDYLSFVDPDDYVSPDFYELLYAAATSDGGHDVARGLWVEVDAKGNESRALGRQRNSSIANPLSSAPLFHRFSGDHWTAIYRRGLFEDGTVRYGTSRKSEDTTFTLYVVSRTKDIVVEGRAEYYYQVGRDSSAINQQNPQRFLYELDGFEEKIAFLDKGGFNDQAYTYLVLKLRFYLTVLYEAICNDSSLEVVIDDYAERLSGIVGHSRSFSSLRSEGIYKALVEKRIVLPSIGDLPAGRKLAGAMSWIGFLEEGNNWDSCYVDESAKAIAEAFLQLGWRSGGPGFRGAGSQIVNRMGTLPPESRRALWIKVFRQIASRYSLRRVLEKATCRAAEIRQNTYHEACKTL